MVLSDKRVLWHPRNHNKFVVGGSSQITLYEWAAEYPEIRHVTSQHDLHHMKCFAWSPDPAFEDLVAVGLSTGRVDLLRLEASKHARKHNILSSGPTVNLPVRTSRSCNALAFSQKDPNYLAVGLDKIRNDPSLVIWDISSARPTLAIASLDAGLDTAALASHPNSRPQPQIPRTDSRADSRIIQQHALTETVSAVSFLPDTSHVLLAGVSQRWLRMFDLRSATPAVTNVASKVQEIATDPFDCHRVACFGDSTVTVWDHRKFGQPLLQFSEKDASADGARIRPNATFIHVEFSAARRNCLATLERDASYVRFWDISETRGVMDGNVFGGSFDQDGRQPREALRGSRRSWANLPWPTAQTQPTNAAPASTPPTERTVQVLTDTRRTKIFPRSLSSFAVVPNTNDSQPLATSVMVVNKEGDLEMYQVHDTPKQALWSSRGEFALGSGTGFKFISGYRDEDDFFEDHPSDIRQPSALPTPYSQFEMGSRSRSAPRRDDLSRRGRAPKNEGIPPGSALFSRDEDPVVPSGVAAQLARNVNDSRKRGYSPSSLRKYATKGGEGDPPLKDFLVSDANASRSRDRTHSPANRKQRDDPLRTARPADSRMPSPGPGSKRKPPNVRHGKQKGISHVIEEDISMVMRKRALKGYCLSKPFDNSTITHEEEDAARSHDDSLSEAWAWLHHSRDVLCTPSPKIHGFDFSFQGLLGLFEGFAPIALPEGQSVDDTPIATQRTLLDVPGGPHPFTPTSALLERQASRRSYSPADDLYGNWNAAITTLVERRGADKSTWKPSAPTMKLSQRHLGLELCGWSLRDEELKAAVKRWEKEGQISRAACWLVFMKQYSKAMDLLYKSNDEKHRMMSGTIAALTPHGSSPLKNPELREHYSRLSVRLQDPYFRMMIIHMGVGDWLEVLEEDVIPFRERLAIAFQFLDDRSLKSYLQRIGADASQTGNIDAIIVTGLTKQGLDVLQAYVDRTGDVQTTAIMGSYVCPVKFQDRRVDRWLNAYRDMLDGFRLHAERVGFDIERGQLVLDALQNGEGIALSKDLVPPQIFIRCHYCNKPVNTTEITGVGPNKARPTTCPNCSRPLPKCSVCLMTLAIIDDATRELDLGYGSYKDTLDDAIVICQTCRHGGHASHILEWFLGEDGRQAHGMCPVAGCDCRCADDL